MRRGAWRAAHKRFEAHLAANPDDLVAQGQLGSAYARSGQYADALPLFEMAPFGSWYESKGLLDHAHALRVLGRGDEAAHVRLSTQVVSSERSGMVTLLSAVDDYLSVGDTARAEELALEAVGYFPRSPAAHAWLATVYVEMDRVEDAEAQLWIGSLQGPPSARGLTLSARLAMQRGELDEARTLLWEAVELRPDSRVVMALRAEVERRDGDCLTALNLLNRVRFAHQEEPEAMAVEALCLQEVGEAEQARELIQRAVELYPLHPQVQAAAEAF